MNVMKETLTISELEALCQAWLDCRLGRSEKAMLRKALAETPLRSPAIDACRRAMGAEVALRRNHPRRSRRFIWLSAAASVALLAALYPLASGHFSSRPADAVVYIAGREISGNRALEIAGRNMDRNLSRMNDLLARAGHDMQRARELTAPPTENNQRHQ